MINLLSTMGRRNGYVYLLSVLFIGAIVVSILSSYMLLSIASLENGRTVQESAQALEYATTCAEQGLSALLSDIGYTGDESIEFENGSCAILNVGGFGNENRTICTEGSSGLHTRRVEILIDRVLPSINIFSWQEVAEITACSY